MNLEGEVTRGLSLSDPEERRRAVSRISELAPDSRVAPLLLALGDVDWRVRKEAIAVCAELGPEPELLSALVDVFEPGDNVGLRNATVEALGAFGAAAVDALARRLPSYDADGKKLAIEALARSGQATALEALAPLVDDADANVRVAALEAIGQVGGARVDAAKRLLVPRLDRARPLETLASLEALASIGAGLPFSAVEAWLGDPLLGRAALSLVAEEGDPRAASPLVEAFLTDLDAEVVSALADYVTRSDGARRAVLAEVNRVGEPFVRQLLGCLSRHEGDVERARGALAVVGALGIGACAELAVSWLSDPRCYSEADLCLFLLGDAAVPALIRGAATPEAETAAACLDLLGRLPPESVTAEARGLLTAALRAPSLDVVRAALGALTRVGDASSVTDLASLLADAALVASTEPALVAILQRHPERASGLIDLSSPHGPLAHGTALAVVALAPRGRVGSFDASELTSFLLRVLASTSHDERRAALWALGELGAPEALDAVRFALADEEPSVRVQAVRALGRLRSTEQVAVGVPALLEVVAEARDAELALVALRALGESSDARALGVLGPLVRAGDARLAVAAVDALSRHADSRRLSSLFDGLHHAEPEVVKAAMLAIAAEPDPRVIVHLGACLDHSAWDVRRLAADLLGRTPNESSAALLRARLGAEHDPMVKDALSRVLESSGKRRSRPPRRPQGER